jgi:hypothetical protein
LFFEQHVSARHSGKQGRHETEVGRGADREESSAVGLVQGQPQRETVEQLRGGDPDPGCQKLSGITQGRVERCGVEPALAVEVHEQPRSGTKWPNRLGFGHLAAQRHEPARRDRHAGQMVTRLLEGHRPLHAAQRQWH